MFRQSYEQEAIVGIINIITNITDVLKDFNERISKLEVYAANNNKRK